MTWKQVRGSWVMAPDGAPLGRVRDMVVNPHTGNIPALWINSADGMKLLAVDEINRWTRTEIFIESLTDLILPEEFPRLKKVLQQEVSIINAPVFEKAESLKKIGTCNNFSFDTLSPSLLSLETISGWLIWQQTRIIHRRQILEMKKNGIFVSIPILAEKIKRSSSPEMLQGSLPEAETSQSFRGE